MARRIPLHTTGASRRLVRHLLAGRLLRRRMYATTPIPFLRRLHLIPDAPHFDALSSGLPSWWAADPRFSVPFELPVDSGNMASELGIGDRVEPLVDVAPDRTNAPLQANVDRRPEVAAPEDAQRVDAQRTAAPTSRREESVALPQDTRLVPSSTRAFYQPVVLRTEPSFTRRRIGTARVAPPAPVVDLSRVPSVSTSAEGAERVQSARTASAPEPGALPAVPIEAIAPIDEVAAMMAPVPASDDDVTSDHGVEREVAVESSAAHAPLPRPDLISLSEGAPEIAATDAPIEDFVVEAIAPPIVSRTQEHQIVGEPAAGVHEASRESDEVEPSVPQPPTTVAAQPRRRARVQELHSDQSIPDARTPRESSPPLDPARDRPVRPPSSRPATPEPPREREGDRLFQPVEDSADQSPAAWAARLAQALRAGAADTRPSPPADRARAATTAPHVRPGRAPVPGRASASPSPVAPVARSRPEVSSKSGVSDVSNVQISETSRRFLKPLVGIDPADVTIVQGPAADQLADARQADALAIGDDTVVVRSDFAGTMPRDLGLLAHELTHIARARRPRFIPPAARPIRRALPAMPSEEDVAGRVESRVVALAHDGAAQRTIASRVADAVSHGRRMDAIDVAPIDEPNASQPSRDWGGLPAPWEPLPDWIEEPAPAAESAPNVGRSSETRSLAVAAPQAATPIAVSAPAIQPAVHAADPARVVDAPGPAAAAQPGGDGQPHVAPDIDQLARQVYAALKRRLEADARRERMFKG